MGTVTRFPKANLRLPQIPVIAIDDGASARFEASMIADTDRALRWIAMWFITTGTNDGLEKFSHTLTDVGLETAKAISKRTTDAERRGDL